MPAIKFADVWKLKLSENLEVNYFDSLKQLSENLEVDFIYDVQPLS